MKSTLFRRGGCDNPLIKQYPYLYSRVRNRRRAGNKRKAWKFGKNNKCRALNVWYEQNVQSYVEKKTLNLYINICRPWKKIKNLISVDPTFIPDHRVMVRNTTAKELQ